MKEDLVLIEVFSFIWIKVILYATVKRDYLILLMVVKYLRGNQKYL